MKIVETQEEILGLIEMCSQERAVYIPIYADSNTHPAVNQLSVLGVYIPSRNEAIVIPLNHSESQNTEISTVEQLFKLSHFKPIHVQAAEWMTTGSVTPPETFLPVTIKHMQERFRRFRNVNRAVPLVKWAEYVQEWGKFLSSVIQQNKTLIHEDAGYEFLTQTAIPVLQQIESAGIHVDAETFLAYFKRRPYLHDLVYSQYNLFTSTGRPSCSYSGINFAAINKTDGSRKSFTSRFKDGIMVLLDFESYHLRLIAKILNYPLPSSSVHEFFGQQYFHSEKLTSEQYELSKRKSFLSLYSDKVSSTIPFFQLVGEYKQKLWADIQKDGYITSSLGRRIYLSHISTPSPAKVCNFLIQWEETERNLRLLKEILPLYEPHQSKIVLYNYDAILIDYCLGDGKQLLYDTVTQLEGESREFPVRIYCGKSYGELKRINLKSLQNP